jgi:hypothetical protein
MARLGKFSPALLSELSLKKQGKSAILGYKSNDRGSSGFAVRKPSHLKRTKIK